MSKRSPTGEPLSEEYKAVLRPYFGQTVDKVTIHWTTPPLDEWAADNFKISLEGVMHFPNLDGKSILNR